MNQTTGRHHLLPATMTPELLQQWIIKNSASKFTDEGKRYFSEEELNEMSRTSAAHMAEILMLEEIGEKVKKALTKGVDAADDAFNIYIPPTSGTKVLEGEAFRLADAVDKGYETFTRDVFYIPNADNEVMVCFGLDGIEVEDRTRPMSPSEKNKYGNLFATGSRLNIEHGQERTGTDGDAQN